MEGLSAELDFALKSRDPYPINLESLVDLLKYKHISSLTTHLKRHFQRDIDYKKFHQVRNKRQICVYYISVDCFKQICGFCRHTQRKEIAQNLLGTMTISDVKAESGEMSFTEMLNDINDLTPRGDPDSEEEDDIKMRQSSPPSKSIKIEKGSFVTNDPQSLFNRYGRTQLHNNMAMLKRGGNISEITPAPTFSNNIYNFNNLSSATSTQSITPIIPTPAMNNKSNLSSALSGAAFNSTFNPANALANAAISNTNNSAFLINNNTNNSTSPFTFNNPYTFTPLSNNSTSNFTPFSSTSTSNFAPSTTSISSFSSNSSNLSPVTNINTITPFSTPNYSTPIPINASNTTPTPFSSINYLEPIAPTPQINTHKRSSSSRASPIPLTSSNTSLPITQVTSTITPTPIITSSNITSTLPITAPITPTPVFASAPTPFSPSSAITTTPISPAIKTVTPITPINTVKSPTPTSPRTSTPTPKSNVTKLFGFGSLNKNPAYLNTLKGMNDTPIEMKGELDSSLFDFGLTTQPIDMQYYDDYLTLSSSPTSIFDPVNTLAEVDKIYEQWEQERGGPRLFE